MSSISIRVDTNDKSMFEDFCESVGMNVTTALNMFIKNVINNQRLPFAIERDPFFSEINIARLKKAAKNAQAGKHIHYHDLIEG